MAAAPVLRSQGARLVLEALERHQGAGASSRALAAELGLANGTVSYHARRLEEQGLVRSAGGAFHITEAGLRARPLAA